MLIAQTPGLITGSFPKVTNAADWICDIEVVDDDTEEPIDISTATFTVEVQDCSGSQVLLATTGNGRITTSDEGVFRFTFSKSLMSSIDEGQYNVGVSMLLDGVTYQLIVADVPIVEGFIS